MKSIFVTASLVGCLFVAAVGCTASSSGGGDGEDGPVVLPEQQKKPVATPPSSSSSPEKMKETGEVSAPAAEQYVLPAWTREDVQPKSARFGQSYGLADQYTGKTLVVVLLEGHCPYCQSNSLVAQQLQEQFDSEGLEAQIVVLGDLNAGQFASKVSLPIFRDHDGNAWDEMRPNASKHDTFVFGPDGKRTYFWLGSYQGDATRWRADIGKAVRDVAKKK